MSTIERIFFNNWSVEPGLRGDGAQEVDVRFTVRVSNDPVPEGQEFHRRFGYKIDIVGDPRDRNSGPPRDEELEHIFGFSRLTFRPVCNFNGGRIQCDFQRGSTDIFPFAANGTRVGSDLDAGSLDYVTTMHNARIENADLDVAQGREIQLPRMFGGGSFRLSAEDRIYAVVSIVEYSTGRVVRTQRSTADREVYEEAPA